MASENVSGVACSLEYKVLWWDLLMSTREIPRMSTGMEKGQIVPIAELGELTFVVACASIVSLPNPRPLHYCNVARTCTAVTEKDIAIDFAVMMGLMSFGD